MSSLCLINPASGTGEGRDLYEALDSLKRQGRFNGEVRFIQFKSLNEELSTASDVDRVFVAGGDGTVSEVTRHLRQTSPKIGIIPLGTGNDLARELGLFRVFSSSSLPDFLTYLENAPAVDFTLGELAVGTSDETRISFCNYASFGFDAQVVDTFSKYRFSVSDFMQPSRLGNRALYALAGLRHFQTRLPTETVLVESESEDQIEISGTVMSLIFANISSYMGLGKSNHQSSCTDGRIEVVAARNPLDYAKMLLKQKRNILGSAASWDLQLTSDSLIQIDGEPFPVSKSNRFFRISAGRKLRFLAKAN